MTHREQPETRVTPPESPETVRPGAAHGFEDHISLRDLVIKVWRGKWLILIAIILSALAASWWMKRIDPLYTAQMVVAPSRAAGGSSLPVKLGELGEVGAVFRLDVGSSEQVSDFTLFLELLTSVQVMERLQQKYGLLQVIYEGAWNVEKGDWEPPRDLVSRIKGRVRAFFGHPTWTPPSTTQLAAYIIQNVKIQRERNSGVVTLGFRHKDPAFAAKFLRWLHTDADNMLREQTLKRTQYEISYIERKLETVSIVEYRRALVELLSEREKVMMMIEADLPFAAAIIEPPVASDAPTFPRPVFVLAASVLGGLVLGILVVFLIRALRSEATGQTR